MPALKWSSAEHLKEVLNQHHIDWFSSYLKFDPRWIEGESDSAHQLIFSYKAPKLFHKWLECNLLPDQWCRFKLYLITASKLEIEASSTGPFAVVCEEFGDTDETDISRFYHLTHGATLNHRPCLLHLMQLLAIAQCHHVILQRSTLPITSLISLSNHDGFIPDYLAKCSPHPLGADHEFWEHFSGNSTWIQQLRLETDLSLRNAGLIALASTVSSDRTRYARPEARK